MPVDFPYEYATPPVYLKISLCPLSLGNHPTNCPRRNASPINLVLSSIDYSRWRRLEQFENLSVSPVMLYPLDRRHGTFYPLTSDLGPQLKFKIKNLEKSCLTFVYICKCGYKWNILSRSVGCGAREPGSKHWACYFLSVWQELSVLHVSQP